MVSSFFLFALLENLVIYETVVKFYGVRLYSMMQLKCVTILKFDISILVDDGMVATCNQILCKCMCACLFLNIAKYSIVL